jgi:hypothetical protein
MLGDEKAAAEAPTVHLRIKKPPQDFSGGGFSGPTRERGERA